MSVGSAGSMALIIGGILLVLILLKILFLVHAQTRRVKELEAQMKLIDKSTEMAARKEK